MNDWAHKGRVDMAEQSTYNDPGLPRWAWVLALWPWHTHEWALPRYRVATDDKDKWQQSRVCVCCGMMDYRWMRHDDD